MSAETSTGRGPTGRRTLGDVVANMGLEVLPFKNTEQNVLKFIPKSVRLTVTASPPKGIEATIALAVALAGHGYQVAPHLSAKMISGPDQLSEFIQRLDAAGIDSIFVVGGDAEEPAGEYTDAVSLLKAIEATGHRFREVGVGGYPEGHHFIPQDALDAGLIEKAKHATYIATQICYDAPAIISWAARIKTEGVDIPIRVGMPGAVSREKLLRISLASGVGASLKFLQKQKGMFWRFFVPGGYSPDKLIRGLKPAIGSPDNNLQDFHIFTFNEIEGTEVWRQKMQQKYPS